MKAVKLVVLFVSLSVCAYAQTGTIDGQIIDRDGKPLAGVKVSMVRVGFNQHFEARSDSDGRYRHLGLPTGRYELTISKDGKSVKLDTRVRFDNPSKVDFDLRQLMPYDREQRHRVTATALTVPRKAQEEYQKAYDARDNLEKAQQHLEKAVQIAPDFEDALNDLGTIYHRKHQYAEAAALFERALKINADLLTARVNLGGTLIALNDYERALTENLRVLAVRPDDALAHGQAGLALYHLRRYEEAIPHFQQAKQFDPDSALLPGFFLAAIYDILGKSDAAITEYEEFLKTHPAHQPRADIEARLRVLKSRH
jgi:tetratricopeptide (TPR) repeat protein